MTGAWLWARSELRTRWRSWLILGLLVGSTFGLAAAGFAGARRTSVALPNYVAAYHAPTAAVLPNDPSFDEAKRARVAALPEVRTVYPFLLTFQIDGGALRRLGWAPPDHPRRRSPAHGRDRLGTCNRCRARGRGRDRSEPPAQVPPRPGRHHFDQPVDTARRACANTPADVASRRRRGSQLRTEAAHRRDLEVGRQRRELDAVGRLLRQVRRAHARVRERIRDLAAWASRPRALPTKRRTHCRPPGERRELLGPHRIAEESRTSCVWNSRGSCSLRSQCCSWAAC